MSVGTATEQASSQDFFLPTADPILEFSGDHRWLSNFHDFIIDLGGIMFPSAEHAFQATKTLDAVERKQVQLARSPRAAKSIGQLVTLRPGWDDGVSIEMMRLVLAAKFPTGDKALTPKLLATGDALLVEGNNWGDVFWGARWQPLWMTSERYGLPLWAERQHANATTDQLRGENHLGLLLMERRAELRKVAA